MPPVAFCELVDFRQIINMNNGRRVSAPGDHLINVVTYRKCIIEQLVKSLGGLFSPLEERLFGYKAHGCVERFQFIASINSLARNHINYLVYVHPILAIFACSCQVDARVPSIEYREAGLTRAIGEIHILVQQHKQTIQTFSDRLSVP